MAEQRAAVDRMAVVRRWLTAMPGGDWVQSWHDDEHLAELRAFAAAAAAPDLEVVPMGAGGGELLTPAARGADGLIEFWQEWLEPWESFAVDIERIEEGPEGVLIEVVQRGRMQGSDAEVETPSAAVHFFEGERMSRIEFHLDREDARRAAGL